MNCMQWLAGSSFLFVLALRKWFSWIIFLFVTLMVSRPGFHHRKSCIHGILYSVDGVMVAGVS